VFPIAIGTFVPFVVKLNVFYHTESTKDIIMDTEEEYFVQKLKMNRSEYAENYSQKDLI